MSDLTPARLAELRTYAGKAIRCAPLLPAPGDVEVALFARHVLALIDEVEQLRAGQAGRPDVEAPRDGKVKVVVRGMVDSDGAARAWGWHENATAPVGMAASTIWEEVEELTSWSVLPGQSAARFEALLWVTPPSVEQVEAVEKTNE